MEDRFNTEFLFDKGLSLKSKGLLSLVLAMPKGWEFSVHEASKYMAEGKTAMYATINELKKAGYCVTRVERDELGRIYNSVYVFSSKPIYNRFHE